MGKSQKYRNSRSKRVDPTGLNEASESIASTPTNTASSSSDPIPVIKSLTSANADDRAWSAAAISNLIQDPPTRKLLLKANVVPILIKTLVDPAPGVALEVAGAIRNMVVIGGQDIVQSLVQNQISTVLMTVIEGLVAVATKVLNNVPSEGEKDDEERKIVWDFCEQVIAIIWSLCESSGKATTSLSTPAILSFILSFLQPNDSIPTSLVIISAQTLATITEENKEINKHFTEAYLEGLHDIVSGKQVFSSIPEDVRPQLRILCAGSLYNLRKLLPNGSEIYKLATPAIEVALNIPYKSFVDAVIAKPIDSAEPNANEEDNEAMMEEDPSHQEHILEAQQHSSDFTQIKEYKQFETQMSTVQFALELLTNICSSEEFEEESDDGEWGDVKEEEEEVTPAAAAEEDDAIMEAEMDNPAAEDEELQDLIALSSSASTPAPTSDISETNLHHLTTNLFPRLLELAAPVTNIPETHKQYLTTSTSLITLRSLECLNNCLLQFPVTWFQEFNIVELWNWCFNLASSMNLETLETEVVDAFLGVLAGIAKGSDKAGKKIMASPETVTPLLNLPWTLATSSITKLINLLSILGKSPCPVDINRQIGTFLMTNILRIVNAAPGTSSLSIVDSVDIVSEILDGIFDIYGDETYDYDQGVFFKDGYLDKLANVSMKMRVAVKNVDKRRHRMVREKADLALINLRGFLQYKNGEYKKLGLL